MEDEVRCIYPITKIFTIPPTPSPRDLANTFQKLTFRHWFYYIQEGVQTLSGRAAWNLVYNNKIKWVEEKTETFIGKQDREYLLRPKKPLI
jgi:hypothetical protein